MAAIRILERLISDSEHMNQKSGVKKRISEKDPLFNDYNPDNSLLNVTFFTNYWIGSKIDE